MQPQRAEKLALVRKERRKKKAKKSTFHLDSPILESNFLALWWALPSSLQFLKATFPSHHIFYVSSWRVSRFLWRQGQALVSSDHVPNDANPVTLNLFADDFDDLQKSQQLVTSAELTWTFYNHKQCTLGFFDIINLVYLFPYFDTLEQSRSDGIFFHNKGRLISLTARKFYNNLFFLQIVARTTLSCF